MKFIIDGDYDKELITSIYREKLPVTHIIVHVPHNPLGNSSIFLPKNLPSTYEFEEYTRAIKQKGIIPIAGLDSTCQGNLEAHIQQYKALDSLFKKLQVLGFKDILVSSPNNIGYVKQNYPSMNIYLSYSQFVTSLNRGKIFFRLGTKFIILHPDIIRDFHALKNFIKLKDKKLNYQDVGYILPLNLGCNWGCIHWYQHHNLQSHRTISSPILSNQENISNIENGFDYPLLYCWKKRLEEPVNILKAGWITPNNIELYQKLGYDNFLLFTAGFSTEKIIGVIESYKNKTLKQFFNEFLNIPEPYGEYWPKQDVKASIIQLHPDVLANFCRNYPYQNYYPFEESVNHYCKDYLKLLEVGDLQKKENIVKIINREMLKMEKGTI